MAVYGGTQIRQVINLGIFLINLYLYVLYVI